MGKNRNNRAHWHDYSKKGIYHITLLKKEGINLFSKIIGNADSYTGTWADPHPSYFAIGKAISSSLRYLPEIHPALLLLKYCIMPDHLHILLQVTEDLDETLGSKIARFKAKVNELAGITGIFEEGFHDHIILPNHDLNTVYKYIEDNPRRYQQRRQYKEYFSKVNKLLIGNKYYQAYGNLLLLQNPNMAAVAIHRATSAEQKLKDKAYWEYIAANRGVLISPFVSKEEKAVRDYAINNDGRLIILKEHLMDDREKPFGTEFNLCTEGRLLILIPLDSEFHQAGYREQCLEMNEIAEGIAELARQGKAWHGKHS